MGEIRRYVPIREARVFIPQHVVDVKKYVSIHTVNTEATPRKLSSTDESEQNGRIYHHVGFDYYKERSIVIVAGQEVHLNAGENRLLALFTQQPNKILSHLQLMTAMYPHDADPMLYRNEIIISTYITWLRKKIQPTLSSREETREQSYIRTNYKQGYLLYDPSKLPGA